MQKNIHKRIQVVFFILGTFFILIENYLLSGVIFSIGLTVFFWHKSFLKRLEAETSRLNKEIEELKLALETSGKENTMKHVMETTGRLAGGVAHDLNNILSGLVTYPELLLMDLPDDSHLNKPLSSILKSGQRASAVVSDLVTISKGISGNKIVMNINTSINEFLKSADFQVLASKHPGVHIEPITAPDLMNTIASQDHISAILKNLVTHGVEATMDEGKVVISTENRYMDLPHKGYQVIPPGEYVVLSISDSGPMIAPEDLQRIFEPYYCKKVMERSCSGLGLPIVWNMVHDNKGFIDLKSTDKKTVYELYFSITREEMPVAFQENKPSAHIAENPEKILVIDDEELQREIAEKILTGLGYHVTTVSSGEKALEYLKSNTVDLIVLDMIMTPGINGYATYKQIVEIYPSQKAVIASGFSKSAEVEKAQLLGAGKYISKPYTIDNLARAVRDELKKKPDQLKNIT